MKDLSNQSFYSRPKRSGSFKKFKVVALLILVIGVVYIVISRVSPTSVGGSSSAKLQDAPIGLMPVDIDGSERVSEDGVSLNSQSISLVSATDTILGSGTASRTYGGGTYSLNVNANLPDPGSNKYGVWLTGGGETRLIDYMSGSGNNWTYSLRDTDNYSNLNGVIVSREITTNDENMELVVLQGSF